jgi:SEC-C motif
MEDKIHRNAPCPCGSGKKYKKCHGPGRLTYAASNTTYVNGFGDEGQLTLSQVGYTYAPGVPFGGDPTVQSVLGGTGAVTLGGVAVVLSQSFYNGTAAYQATALVHELLHITFRGPRPLAVTTVGIANLFGLSYNTSLTGNALVTAASNAIQSWLSNDCQK